MFSFSDYPLKGFSTIPRPRPIPCLAPANAILAFCFRRRKALDHSKLVSAAMAAIGRIAGRVSLSL